MSSVADLAEVLRDPARLDALIARDGAERVLADARRQAVAGLLARARPDVPVFADERRLLVLEEALRDAEMRRVFAAFGARGLRPAIIKGAAWAHSHYPAPWVRERLDLDVLILRDEQAEIFAALEALGYVREAHLHGQFAGHQELYERTLGPGMRHKIDVHWEVSNRAFFARRLPAADLLGRASPAPYGGPFARQLHPVDSLLLACVHRAAHHADEFFLVWWHDVFLLGAALSRDAVDLFERRAVDLQLAGLCAHELTQASAAFSANPAGATGALDAAFLATLANAGRSDRSRRFLRARGPLADAWLDIVALPSWRDRLTLVREHLFPPRSFMLRGTRAEAGGWLPWLYTRRIVAGLSRWLGEKSAP